MKTLVILFAGADCTHAFEKKFAGKSAFERSLAWACGTETNAGVYVFTTPENKTAAGTQMTDSSFDAMCSECGAKRSSMSIIQKDSWTNASIISEIAAVCAKEKADNALYAWGNCPFLNKKLTEEIISTHTKYLAEYTFADGYPYGLTPEMIDSGAAAILASLATGTQKSAGDVPASRDALFSIMKGDINSFEIETVIAPKDYRMLRLTLACGAKTDTIACERLFDAAASSSDGKRSLSAKDIISDACALSDIAEKRADVISTVPAFYNVQIAGKCCGTCTFCPYPQIESAPHYENMSLSSFKKIVSQMADLSEQAVVALSAWGEPLLHPDFAEFVKEVLSHKGLSVFIETDGTLVTPELSSAISALAGAERITWVVSLDAVDAKKYAELHGTNEADFAKAVSAVAILGKDFPHRVYPQFVRTKQNEDSLEQFYRYWKEKTNPSNGELIIQKYDRFCGLLPDVKSADLSPLERNPCWHIRRDMTILADGSVPLCRDCISFSGIDDIKGNVFNESVEAVWDRFRSTVADHINQNYSKKCQDCDEYYTFNF
jgi:spiro-SPASM protein